MRRALLAVTLLMSAAGNAAEDRSHAIWPMYRGNLQRTGLSPFKGPAPMRVKWEVDLKREICASPAIGPDGTIYVGAGAIFYAVTPAGQSSWSHDFSASGQTTRAKRGSACGDNQAFTSPSPAIAPDGTLYQVGGRNGEGCIMALDSRPKAENRIKWTFKTSREMRASPFVAQGSCFVGDAMVTTLDLAGKRKWMGGKAEFAAVTSSPALSLDGMTLYVGGFDGRLHALDAATGKEKWTARPEKKSAIRLPQWDAQGMQLSGFTTAGYIPEAPAVGPDGTIYFGSWDGHLYAAAPDGRLRWAIDLKDRVTSAPAVSADGRVLVCTYEGALCAVRAVAGRPMLDWWVPANARYSSPLISADGKVYVGTLDGKLRAYALANGRLLGELALGSGWIYASPVPGADGLLYVGGSDGFLRAIEAAPASPASAGRVAAVEAGKRAGIAFAQTVSVRSIPPKPASALKPASYDEALRLARAYMDENDEAKRASILQKVAGWSERLDDIALALRPVPPAGAPEGLIVEDKFRLPHVRAWMARLLPKPEGPVQPYVLPKGSASKGPAPGEEYLNWVHVPENYDPRKPLGLIISLHGGAGSTPQSAAGEQMKGAMKQFGGGDFIIVCPSTPPMIYSWGSAKFCFPESELHIQSVIEEYSARYAIDPNRVYLTGFSMGGVGSWWQAFRHGDRFAVIAPMAGSWRAAYWPKLRGTMLCLMNGVFDHHLHVDFTRHAHTRMMALGIPHVDAEYLGAHGPGLAQEQKGSLVELFQTVRRNPYVSRVCAVSPFVPESRSERYPRQPHSFWASVLEAGPGGIPVDYAGESKERGFEGGSDGSLTWQRKMFTANRRLMNAGAVDAENLGGNRFRVRATNTKRFALWLHPKMGVDFRKPIEIELIHMAVDSKTNAEVEQRRERVTTTARPSLAAMLKYLDERHDFGLIYHAVIEIE